jgi:hypothetical protein
MTRTDINNNKEGSNSSVNAASNAASKFVIRDIVLKKKNPQHVGVSVILEPHLARTI